MLFTQVTATGCSSSSYPAFPAICDGVLYRRVVQRRSAWNDLDHERALCGADHFVDDLSQHPLVTIARKLRGSVKLPKSVLRPYWVSED